MHADPKLDLMPRLAALMPRFASAAKVAELEATLQTTLRSALPKAGPGRAFPGLSGLPGQGADARLSGISDGLAPAMRDMLTRFSALKPGAGLCEMGRGGGPHPAVTVPEGARFEEFTHRGTGGALAYRLYVPRSQATKAMPLVVMLHGCTQSPEDFAAGTRMNDIAEEQGFLVAYPRQTSSANAQKCWNWFDAKDQTRDRGEPALIAGLTRDIIRDFGADPTRVYVAGLSAGGGAAAIMAQCYPDLYAAAGVHSGLASGVASDIPSAFAAMRAGGRATAGRPMPTIVFHGDADRTVHPANAEQVIAQGRAGAVLTADVSQGRSPGGLSYTRTVESKDTASPALELWELHGVGHAWSGGSSAGSYTEPRGPDASREMVRFFLQHRCETPAG